MSLVVLVVVDTLAVMKLLWIADDNSHALQYYCRHVLPPDGRCEPTSSLFIKLLRRDDVKSAVGKSSLDSMSVALRSACLEPGDLHVSDQNGQSQRVTSLCK